MIASMRIAGAMLMLAMIGDAAALNSSAAKSRDRHGRQLATERIARSLLQANHASGPESAAAPAPAGPPLTTPADAMNVCSTEVLRKATKCKKRKHVWYEEGGAEADEDCCKLISQYYSNASTMQTRNCWCDADVWARNAELELVTQISLADFFDACIAENFTVGEDAVAYYQDGAGPCAGLPAEAAKKEEKEMEKPPKRSFGKWVREGLPDNPWVLFSFIVAIPSVIGFNIVMWPFVFHTVLTIVELPQKRAAKKAL